METIKSHSSKPLEALEHSPLRRAAKSLAEFSKTGALPVSESSSVVTVAIYVLFTSMRSELGDDLRLAYVQRITSTRWYQLVLCGQLFLS